PAAPVSRFRHAAVTVSAQDPSYTPASYRITARTPSSIRSPTCTGVTWASALAVPPQAGDATTGTSSRYASAYAVPAPDQAPASATANRPATRNAVIPGYRGTVRMC